MCVLFKSQVHTEESPKPVRCRFRPAAFNENVIPIPVLEMSPKRKDLGKLLSKETL
ncbi:MAG: hypothetical protein HYY20_03240 [Candidatus Tectomicrobia bacterium]|uniref:Uncharacterized protein n=1 Tax=Tectimicrobiota bacterium TaxID=2528274 RepID=A0A932FW27_UNCTE|nr:hypothetical protein [Candidatus Tectomicrobia bacterium]